MLDYDFMRTAFAAATVVAVVSGAVGYFLVLRGQTFAGHALAHVGFTGATGAFLVGVAPLWGLVLATVAAGVGMGLMGERLAQRDVAIGLVLSLFSDGSSTLATVLATMLFGAAFGVVWALVGYAATRGQRDFSSVTAVVATKYEVLVEHKSAAQARELLAGLPGALPNPFA